jgi:hypothetical protein
MNYLVVARDDLSGWVEARALHAAKAAAVARFLWEDVICRHGCFGKLVVDGGPENKKWGDVLASRYNIHKVVTSAYHPQANGMIERGHTAIVDALSKMTNGGLKNWVTNLHSVLWADRTTIRRTTGLTPFRLNYGNEAVLPIELEIPTWQTLAWSQVRTTGDLLAVRAQQLQRRDKDMQEAVDYARRMREASKDPFDTTHQLHSRPFCVGDIVLLHDSKRETSYTNKLAFRWLGPYRIYEAFSDKGTFLLEELDGSPLASTIAGNRIKRFIPRQPTDREDTLSLATPRDLELEVEDELEEVDLLAMPQLQKQIRVVVPSRESPEPVDFVTF